MILLIIKSYLTLFIYVGTISIVLFLIGFYWILSKVMQPSVLETDFSTIAGDDVASTQLDLARAYIETNNKKMAKYILKAVMQQGSKVQKNEARSLLKSI